MLQTYMRIIRRMIANSLEYASSHAGTGMAQRIHFLCDLDGLKISCFVLTFFEAYGVKGGVNKCFVEISSCMLTYFFTPAS